MKIYEVSNTDLYCFETIVNEKQGGAFQIFGRSPGKFGSGSKKGKLTRKFRCPTGPRKGRIVAKPETCNAPLNVQQSTRMKGTRRAKGSIQGAKASYTKKYSPASIRTKKMNTSLKKLRGRARKSIKR
tara:strand:- start:129 stop:512 length:384 start_codon:yes stop_codon:yes gene_type:complete